MNQEQPIGSDQQGLVSARRRSAARWELKSRVALTVTTGPLMRITYYRQQGNCLSAPPVGSPFFGLPNDFFYSSLYGLMNHTTLDAPMFPFCSLCFFHLSGHFYYAALTAQWSLCLCHGLSHHTTMPLFFHQSFSHSLRFNFLYHYNKGNSFLV